MANGYAADFETGPRVDVTRFDIAGLKLGMDFNEAKQILMKKGCRFEYAAQRNDQKKHPVTGKVVDYNMSPCKAPDGGRISTSFQFRFPVDEKRPVALVDVYYNSDYGGRQKQIQGCHIRQVWYSDV
jgi:hypothetical protein